MKNSLEYSSSQVQKCHELYSILLVRHGVMLLGPTGGGKTTVLKLLESALNQCYSDYYGPKSFQGISKDVNSMASVASVHQVRQSLHYLPLHSNYYQKHYFWKPESFRNEIFPNYLLINGTDSILSNNLK